MGNQTQTAAKGGGTGGTSSATGRSSKPFVSSVEPWRKKKTFGESMERDGRTYYWCLDHKMEGDYDGLYVFHPPSGHAEWLANKQRKIAEKKANYAARQSTTSANTGTNSNAAPKNENASKSEKLKLTDSLRAAMVTNSSMTPEEINDIVDAHSGN
jgi:hypothetical protein